MTTATDFLHIKMWTLMSSHRYNGQTNGRHVHVSALEGAPYYGATLSLNVRFSNLSAHKTHWTIRRTVVILRRLKAWRGLGFLYLFLIFAHSGVQHARLVFLLHGDGEICKYNHLINGADEQRDGSWKSRALNESKHVFVLKGLALIFISTSSKWQNWAWNGWTGFSYVANY